MEGKGPDSVTRVTTDRPSFLRGLASTGAILAAVSPAAPALAKERAAPAPGKDDRAILLAAQIAEALAVTTYTHFVASAPFFTRLFPQDQAYLRAARQQEMAHY